MPSFSNRLGIGTFPRLVSTRHCYFYPFECFPPQTWVVSAHSRDDQNSAEYWRGPFIDLYGALSFLMICSVNSGHRRIPRLSSISPAKGVFWGVTGSLPWAVVWKPNCRAGVFVSCLRGISVFCFLISDTFKAILCILSIFLSLLFQTGNEI